MPDRHGEGRRRATVHGGMASRFRVLAAAAGIAAPTGGRDLDFQSRIVLDRCAGRRMQPTESTSARHPVHLLENLAWAMTCFHASKVTLPRNWPDRVFSDAVATRAKCGYVARVLHEGRPDLVPSSDRGWVASALLASGNAALVRDAGLLPVSPIVPPRQPDGPVPVRFGFHVGYMRDTSHNKHPVAYRYLGDGHVVPLHATDAPVVCRLDWPDPDAEPMAIRLHDSHLLRPVLRPGTVTPIGLDDFLRVAAEAPAWADNPFRERPTRTSTLVSLLEYASEDTNTRNAARAAATARGILDRTGPLHVVDGVVHRRTSRPVVSVVHLTPTLGVAGDDVERRPGAAEGLTLGWTIPGDIDMHLDQRTVRVDAVTARWDLEGPRSTGACGYPAFGLGDLDTAREFSRSCRAHSEERGSAAPLWLREHDWLPEAPLPVRDVDGIVFPTGRPVLEWLATLRMRDGRPSTHARFDGIDLVRAAMRALDGEDVAADLAVAARVVEGRVRMHVLTRDVLRAVIDMAASEARTCVTTAADEDVLTSFAP